MTLTYHWCRLAALETLLRSSLVQTLQILLRVIEDSTFVAARGAAAQVLASIIYGPSDLG